MEGYPGDLEVERRYPELDTGYLDNPIPIVANCVTTFYKEFYDR